MEQRTGKDEKPAEPRKSKTKMGLLQDIKACDPQLVDSQFSKLCSEFSLRLFSVLTGEPENYTCSPFSLLAALGLALSGARGSTANEILSALGLPAETDPQKNVHENFQKLMNYYVFMLNFTKEFEVTIVNKLLKTKRVDAASSFDEILRKHYGSGVMHFDFASKTAVADVNAWIKAQSNGKIEEVVDKFDDSMRMVVLNAFYIKARLANKFDAKLTKKRVFLNHGEHPIEVLMLSAEKLNVKYSERTIGDVPVQMVEIPCRKDINIVFVLPRDFKQMKEAFKDYKVRTQVIKDIRKFYEKSTEQYVDVTIPKFDIASTREVSCIFKELGITEIFDSAKADFTGVNKDGGLHLSQIIHKTRVEFSEEGTSTTADKEIMRFVPKFVANKPFLFTVRESLNGITLAFGFVVEFK